MGTESSRVAEHILRTLRPLTPTLKLALEVLGRDESLPVTTRVLFSLWSLSWGNWSAYAVRSRPMWPMPPEVPEDLRPMLHDTIRFLILGAGRCPGCSQMASRRSRRNIHPQFRWHVNCLAKAFATDAIAMSQDAEVRLWARDVLAGKQWIPPSEVIQ